jgi:hypothetical protein
MLAGESMGWYEKGSLALQALTLVVLYLTLRKLKEYTDETKRMAEASAEQSPRPCVVVMQSSDPGDQAIVEGTGASISKYVTLHFKNIGTGPALNITYTLDAFVAAGAPLEAGEVFASTWSRQSLGTSATIVVTFESLSGSQWRTTTTIEDRRWVRKAEFHKMPPR